jgi:putative DNA primase/helicase
MDRLQLADKILPWSEDDRVCLLNGSSVYFGWLYEKEKCRQAIECWKSGALPNIPFETVNKNGKTFKIEHPTRLGIVPHRGNNVFYFALDFDAHEGQKPNVHLHPKMARFLQAEPVLFKSKSGQGIRAIYLLNKPMAILDFLNSIRSWGFNRKDRIELFPKTEKLTQFWLPNDPNHETKGDTFISGEWEKSVASLPQKIPTNLTNATLDFLLGFVEPGSRHNALYAAGREMGEKRIQENVSRNLLERGAQLCGLDAREASEAARDGFSRGSMDIQRPAAVEEPNEVSFHFSDSGNAERFSSGLGNEFRFDHTSGKWHRWDGKRWAIDEKAEIYEVMKSSNRELYKLADQYEPGDPNKERVLKYALTSEKRRGLEDAVVLAAKIPQLSVIHSDLDKNLDLFNVNNGTLDLSNCPVVFRPHNKHDLLTKLAPVNYEPDASAPFFDEFLDTIFMCKQPLIEFVQRLLGLCLTGQVLEQVLIFWYGLGCNGKSTFENILEVLFGDYFLRAPANMLMVEKGDKIPNDLARLPGARIVVCSELQDGMRLNESRVKDLTGNDLITARFLHREFFDFRPTHKLFIVGNHKPDVRDSTFSFWRRMVLVPFEATIPESQRKTSSELMALFREENSGILNWLINGYAQYREIGLKIPPEIQAAIGEYRKATDIIGEFLDECCIFGPQFSEDCKPLFEAYTKWAEENNERAFSQKRLGRCLSERGFMRSRNRQGGKAWDGLKLKESSF